MNNIKYECCDIACDPKGPPSEIEEVLEILDSKIAYLELNLDSLESRLKLILRGSDPYEDNLKKVTCIYSPLGNIIESNAARVERASSTIERIINKLAI